MKLEDRFEMLAEEGSMNTVVRRRFEVCREMGEVSGYRYGHSWIGIIFGC